MKILTALDSGKLTFSRTQIDENSKPAVNPSFRVMEEIYKNGKTSFFDNLNKIRPLEEIKLEGSKERPISRTPFPTRYFQEPRKVKKEDVFINPSAFYLSRKPIAFSKDSREALRNKNPSLPPPNHTKSHSMQVKTNKSPNLKMKVKTQILDYSSNENLDKKIVLIPMKEIMDTSPRLINLSTSSKKKNCKVIANFQDYCEETLKNPAPSFKNQIKVAGNYSNEMSWITDVLQSYGQYKPSILKELYKYTSDTRDDIEYEREKIVQMMKTGAYDPNKNVIRLRARLKKKKNY